MAGKLSLLAGKLLLIADKLSWVAGKSSRVAGELSRVAGENWRDKIRPDLSRKRNFRHVSAGSAELCKNSPAFMETALRRLIFILKIYLLLLNGHGVPN